MEVNVGILVDELENSLDEMDDLDDRLAAQSELVSVVERIRDLHLKYVP